MSPTRTGAVRSGEYPLDYSGPRRRAALYVAPGAPYYAALTPTAAGIAVRLARSDRPRGRRLISHDVVDAPLHVVADRLYDEIRELNCSDKGVRIGVSAISARKLSKSPDRS